MSNMPTNRPFFSNFLAAFRANSALRKSATSTQSAISATAAQTSYARNASSSTSAAAATSQTASNARTMATKAPPYATGSTAAAVQAAGQFQPAKQPSTSSYPRTPVSPPSSGFPVQGRQRRGSDSSNEGYKDVSGNEKWYIGGRTPAGDEKFYKLRMVKRYKSADRLSTDRLSL